MSQASVNGQLDSETTVSATTHEAPAPVLPSSVQFVAEPSAGFYAPEPGGRDGLRYVLGVGHLLGYARVSTTDQDAALQLDALNAAGCHRVFVDTISGSLERRPELDRLLDQLRPGDTLVVWRLDRLGRSIRHLIDQLQALADRGVGFRSLQETIDTTSPGGRLVFHVFAALAEHALMSERTRDGLAAARARGRVGGPKPKLRPRQAELARAMYDQVDTDGKSRWTVAQIAAEFGVSRPTVYRYLGEPAQGR